jgi:hypothetical protein
MINMQFRNDQSNLDSTIVKTKHLYAVRRIIDKIGDILSTLPAANQPVRAVSSNLVESGKCERLAKLVLPSGRCSDN